MAIEEFVRQRIVVKPIRRAYVGVGLMRIQGEIPDAGKIVTRRIDTDAASSKVGHE